MKYLGFLFFIVFSFNLHAEDLNFATTEDMAEFDKMLEDNQIKPENKPPKNRAAREEFSDERANSEREFGKGKRGPRRPRLLGPGDGGTPPPPRPRGQLPPPPPK